MIRVAALVFSLLISTIISAQNPVASFATWKNNAKGAYSLIHDDFQTWSVAGIQNYADTIAYNRGIKFTFGAITGSIEEQTWNDARRMIAHGHEIICHTHTHGCAGAGGSNCASATWTSFAAELDQSTNIIFTKTGVYPRFFIWPYDVTTQASKDYLQNTLHYYGARGGVGAEALAPEQLNGPVFTDFMSFNFSIYGPTTNAADLNALPDMCIADGKWGIRETHGVNDASWASVSLVNYRAHMDHLRTQMLSGDLWVATVSEVTTYKMQTQNFIPTASYNATADEIRINWNNPGIDVSDLRSTATLNIDLDGLSGYTYIYQDGVRLTDYTEANGILTINLYPHKGEVVIRKTRWMNIPPGPLTVFSQSVCAGQPNVMYEVADIPGATFAWSYSGTGVTLEPDGNRVKLNFDVMSTNGLLSVTATNGEGTTPSATLSVTVKPGYEVQEGAVCGSGTATLQVVTAGDYEWYDQPTGGTLLSSASVYQPAVTTTTAFYTQRKPETVVYSLGKPTIGTTNIASTGASMGQQFTIDLTMTLTSVKVWFGGSLSIKVLNSNGVMVAQTTPYTSSNMNVPTTFVFNAALQPGTYYLYYQPTSGGFKYESTGNNSPYVMAGVGSVMNNVLYMSANGLAGGMSIYGGIFDGYGPAYDLVFTRTITDPCPRFKVEAMVNTAPADPQFVTPTSVLCPGSTDNLYAVGFDDNITSYQWAYTESGATIHGSGSEVAVDYAVDVEAGNIEVYAVNSCGNSNTVLLPVNFTALPADPQFVTSAAPVCPGSTNNLYELVNDNTITSYQWAYTESGAIFHGTGNTVSVDFAVDAGAGNIEVIALNTCGNSNVVTLPVSFKVLPATPQFESSVTAICAGSTNNVYELTSDANISSYQWTYTENGATINGSGNSVSVDYAADVEPGSIEVYATNSCGNSNTVSLPVNLVASITPTAFILSDDLVTQGDAVAYSISSNAGETYNWAYSGTGVTWTGNSAQITANFSSTSTSGVLSVSSVNACGVESAALTLSVTVEPFVTSVHAHNGDFSVYPNPASESVSIEAPISEGVVNIIDQEGCLIASVILDSPLVNLSLEGLPAGMYIISIASHDKVYRTKLIKQ